MSEGSPPVSPSTDGRPEMGSGGGDDDDDPLVGPSGGGPNVPGGRPMTGYDSDGVDLTGGGMDPDHPLLARAQAALLLLAPSQPASPDRLLPSHVRSGPGDECTPFEAQAQPVEAH